MSFDPNVVINIALNEEGYLEKNSASGLDDKTANAGDKNYTKYGRDMHKIYPTTMDHPAPWCDCFVDWCFYMAYGISNAKALLGGNFDDYTINSAGLYKNKNAWYTSNPQIGDQIFFKNKSNKICHTGIVYKVDDNFIYTVEGNTSSGSGVVANGGAVAKKKYNKTYAYIAGYGRPAYGNDKINNNAKNRTIPELAKPTLKRGSKGNEVKKLQAVLNYILLIKLDVDGDFGNLTHSALKDFQARYNLVVDGIYGPKSADTMKKILTVVAIPTLKKGSKGQEVKNLQNNLNYVVNSNLAVDGDFGNLTFNALKTFQSKNKLVVDGIYGNKSAEVMRKIFLK